MNRVDFQFPRRRERTRCRGSVALIMILVLVLLVGTYAAAVSRRAASEQRVEYERQSRMITTVRDRHRRREEIGRRRIQCSAPFEFREQSLGPC